MPLTAEEARQQAQAEGLTLRVAENTAGYFGVHHQAGKPKPYQAKVKRSGKQARKGETYLGSFATAEEAALCIARWLAVAAERAAAAMPLTAEAARQQAQAEGLTLLREAKNKTKTGFTGVILAVPGDPAPYLARVKRGGKLVSLGYFATAEQAALCVARSVRRDPRGVAGSAAAKRVSSASLMGEEEGAANVPATAGLQGQAQRTGAGDTIDLTTPQDALPGEHNQSHIQPNHTKPDGAVLTAAPRFWWQV